ncbi:L-gulonolactone/D-arabinono-1,4-lactone oxidase [Peniophora sp. CONT]|nr:L-gulonolactone/D-arabinono-1,4-lactone oxidase [Peniophora sp. CONT]
MSLSDVVEALKPITVPAEQAVFENWAGTFRCSPLSIFEPASERDLELIFELARREGRTVRAVGVGHSPSDLACTSGYMVRMNRMDAIVEVNTEKRYVVAQGGIILQRLHAVLDAHGLAMINLGSISDQTLAGMVTTATHGTGYEQPVLSTHVLSVRLMLPDGSRVVCSRTEQTDLFFATLCGLGATGILLDIKMQAVSRFRLREVQDTRPFDAVVDKFDGIMRSSEFVRLWWFPQDRAIRVSAMDKSSEPKQPLQSWLWNSLVGYHVLQFLLFIGIFIPSFNLSVGRFTSWLIRKPTVTVDDSLDVFNIDCKYRQHTTEWAIPYENSQLCLRELRDWFEQEFADPHGLRPHCALEVRVSAADDIWLSPSFGQRMCWIGIMQYKPYGFNVPYRTLFRKFEDIVARHGGRPHWAKAHHLRPADLRAMYPRFDDFSAVLHRIDPSGMMRNEYVSRHIMGENIGERIFKPRP